MENFDMSVWEVMVDSGAIGFWITIAIGMMLIGLLVMILESSNPKIEKIKSYVSESIEEIFGKDK
nr:MAG TPA: hypothetical protein [Caudoviricetes sp.]